MEKLKNLVNPGSKKDDEVLYGSGRSDDPVLTGHPSMGNTNTGSGQASHFGSSRTAGHDSLPTSNNPTVLNQHERDTATRTSQYDTAPAHGASHGLSEPYASRMPGGFDDDDAATTASVSSGIPGQSQSRSAKSGANDPTFTEKPLPHEPAPGKPILGGRAPLHTASISPCDPLLYIADPKTPPAVTGFGHGQSSLTGNNYPDRSVEHSFTHGKPSGLSHIGHDAALAAGAVGTSAHQHEDSQRDNYVPEAERSFPLGGSSTSGGYGSTTAGPHSSNLANKADPRVKSDGSRTTGETGYGSIPGDYTDVTPSSGNQGSISHDPGAVAGARAGAVGPGGATAIGYGPESWQHEHQHHGHQYEGDPCATGAIDGPGGPHFVPGPHLTDTANLLDPHVSSGFGGPGATGDSSGRHHHGHHVQYGEEAALAGGAGATGREAMEADNLKQGTTERNTPSGFDPSETDRHGINNTEGSMYGNNRGSTEAVLSTDKTASPHKSDMLNKMDPRVDSDLSKHQGSHGIDHRYGRDAALTGAGGAGLPEAEKHHRSDNPNLTTSSTQSGMGGPSLLGSGIDAADATRSGMTSDESAVSSAGSGHQPATISGHHHKRNAGLVGAGGIGGYEAQKHLLPSDHSELAATPQDRLAGSGHQPAIANQSSTYPSSSYSSEGQALTGAHTERDSLAAGVVGAQATGRGDKTQKLGDYGRNDPEAQVRELQHPGASVTTYPSPGRSNDSEKARYTSHHTGKDAALVGGAGALAGHDYAQRDAAGYSNEPYHNDSPGYHTGRDEAIGGVVGTGVGPYGDTHGRHHVDKGTVAVGGAGAGLGVSGGHEHSQREVGSYGAEPYQSTSREHHTGRDAAILGGAAGVGGLAEHEYSKKDAAKLQKEHNKEEKLLEKQHSKEMKHHDKAVAKEEKAHEKAIEKSEKKHEKAIEKDERKHRKAIEKDDTKHEHKKHGGLLGFLHRDKPDKEPEEEEAHRRATTHTGRSEGEMATGAGATETESRHGYDPLHEEHGSQSGVHDSPIGIGSGLTTHDAYGAHDLGHNKLHKDPPSKVIESRGYEVQ